MGEKQYVECSSLLMHYQYEVHMFADFVHLPKRLYVLICSNVHVY